MLVATSFLVLASLGNTLAGHYVFWMPFGSKSMKIGVMDMVYGLAAKGHSTTVVTAFKSKTEKPGVKEIVIESEFVGLVQDAIGGILVKKGVDVPWTKVMEQTVKDNRAAFSHPEVQQLLKNQGSVDVVCVVPFGNEPGYYFAEKMNATLALVWTGTQMVPWISWAVGDTFDPATQPMPLLGYTHPMTFPQRLVNTLATGAMALVNELYLRPKSHSLLVEMFPDDKLIPSMDTMAKSSALLVTHSSPFLGHGLQPTMPQTVHSALMGCTPANALPDKLKTFVEEAEHGVIFISFGSVIMPSMMPESKRKALVSVFAGLKQRVIWKWDTEMPDAPPNVLISSWLPQTSLLAHPNLKLFITHAGAGSLQESICYTTPIIAIPINSDQFANANEALRLGIGVSVDWHSLTEETLAREVAKMFEGKSYQNKVETLQRRILDTPQHPLDRAVWWLEYLLRHPSNSAMRSRAHDLHWTQSMMLDVVLFFHLLVLVVLATVYTIVDRCCCASSRRKEKNE